MTTINVTLSRSKKWIREQSIARGENVRESIVVTVPVAELPEDVRTRVYDYFGGRYDDVASINYDRDYIPNNRIYNPYGRENINLDDDLPAVADIVDAIRDAFARVAAAGEEAKAEREAKEAARAASAAEWAALPLDWRASENGVGVCAPMDGNVNVKDYAGPLLPSGWTKYDRDTLRELAPAAYAEAEKHAETLRQIAAGKKAVADRATLAEFLAEVPEDALRGTLKRLAANAAAIAALRERIEAASPVAIFSDDEDE